jgi:hypothetical protein
MSSPGGPRQFGGQLAVLGTIDDPIRDPLVCRAPDRSLQPSHTTAAKYPPPPQAEREHGHAGDKSGDEVPIRAARLVGCRGRWLRWANAPICGLVGVIASSL